MMDILDADEKLLDLLFELVILKYDGERKINPLIEDMVNTNK